MREDSVALFARISAVHLEIRRCGESPARMVRLAGLYLALGKPSSAIEAVSSIISDQGDTEIVIVREAFWICALAICLEVAIMEGHVTGTGQLELSDVLEIPKMRKQAIRFLEHIPEKDVEEVAVLHRVKMGGSLRFVEDVIAGRPLSPESPNRKRL